jgi:diguanylate cyclase (GGDEF)-like protein/putative nucleotidyltransferase with HDIG domain
LFGIDRPISVDTVILKSELTRSGRVYLRVVSVVGFFVVVESLLRLASAPPQPQWALLALLTLISGSASVKLPGTHVSISISEAFVFTAVLLYGPAAGTVTVVLDCLVISFWIAKRRPEFERALFNIAAPAISVWLSAHTFFYLVGLPPLADGPSSLTPTATLTAILPSLVLFAITYFALNSWLIAFVIAIEKHESPWTIWCTGFIWLSLNYFCGASVAVLLVGYTRTIDLRFVAVIVPLLLVLYFTFKTSMQRVEDANKHVDQLNTLYLSTIETLAMAIDAKDQVTHGHIRRVQSYATRLAAAVGVRDKTLMKAIEAAALLHDMGKLAVPEYILNKPGKLTDAEFARMKLHSTVGADILSAIAFPYPVVPIVRHHHEAWDGSGYPDGLKSTQIPIGARILSVVDCFDALTSDRPYRPRLSNDEALDILVHRRGSMYDPLIVDTFIRLHADIAPEPVEDELATTAPDNMSISRKSIPSDLANPMLDEIAASADEMLTLYELAGSLAGQVSVSDASDMIANHLRRLIPSTLCVFYLYDSRSTHIEARHVLGDGSDIVKGLRIPVGQRLSGWVAAHRQTILNSDPALDFGEIARSNALNLKSCISTTLATDDNHPIGVLTLYSKDANAFNEDHRRIIEVVGRQIAHTFQRALEFDSTPRRDQLTGLPNARQLQALIRSTIQESSTTTFALLLIDIEDSEHRNIEHGHATADAVLQHIVRVTQESLRFGDILFRNTSREFVAFLNATDRETAWSIARRIQSNIARRPLPDAKGPVLGIHVVTSATCAPIDGRSLRELLVVARERLGTIMSGSDDFSIH